MKTYDYEKAVKLINENKDSIESASLGMHEDWFWTAETVFENGLFTKDLNEGTVIGGINGSSWATPTLQLFYPDGSDKMIACYLSDITIDPVEQVTTAATMQAFLLGVLSGPVQDNITPITE